MWMVPFYMNTFPMRVFCICVLVLSSVRQLETRWCHIFLCTSNIWFQMRWQLCSYVDAAWSREPSLKHAATQSSCWSKPFLCSSCLFSAWTRAHSEHFKSSQIWLHILVVILCRFFTHFAMLHYLTNDAPITHWHVMQTKLAIKVQ